MAVIARPHFSFVRNAWRAVVAPHYLFFIGLLVVFEATMGLLVLSGGRRAEIGMIGVSGCRLACCCSVG
jgi:hypothetical protein